MEAAEKHTLWFQPGWMNAAGTFGFAPPAAWPWPEPPVAFVTYPLSEKPRRPAGDRAGSVLPGGLQIFHSGWPNPGARVVIRQFAPLWARSRTPVWVHILAETPYGVSQMVRRLEDCENVQSVELGLPPGCTADEALALVHAGLGELPLVLSLEADRLGEAWVARGLADGVSGLSLAAPRGLLPLADGAALAGRTLWASSSSRFIGSFAACFGLRPAGDRRGWFFRAGSGASGHSPGGGSRAGGRGPLVGALN